MTKPFIRIHNIETDEVIDREMTDDEYANFLAIKEADELKAQEEAAKAQERQALLDRLGITAEEAKLLLG